MDLILNSEYLVQCAVTAWSEPATQRHKSGGRTTRKLSYSCYREFCVARQRPVRRFAAVAWRHKVALASC